MNLTVCLVICSMLFNGCGLLPRKMKANGSCAFDVGVKGTDWKGTERWSSAPNGKCIFALESPVKKASDAQTFADAFQKMFLAMPVPEGLPKPVLEKKMEQSQ